jgi:hypothetical protein
MAPNVQLTRVWESDEIFQSGKRADQGTTKRKVLSYDQGAAMIGNYD